MAILSCKVCISCTGIILMPIQLCIFPLGWQLNKQEGHIPNDKLLHLCLEYMKISDKSELLSFNCVCCDLFFKFL